MSKDHDSKLQKEWERRIAVYKASGQTQAKWCTTNDIKIHQLKYWLKKLGVSRTHKPCTKWVPVSIEEPQEALVSPCNSLGTHVTLFFLDGTRLVSKRQRKRGRAAGSLLCIQHSIQR